MPLHCKVLLQPIAQELHCSITVTFETWAVIVWQSVELHGTAIQFVPSAKAAEQANLAEGYCHEHWARDGKTTAVQVNSEQACI